MVKGSANPGNRCVQSYRKSKLISKTIKSNLRWHSPLKWKLENALSV